MKWITAHPEVCHRKPVFKGTRILISDVLELFASGVSIEEILEEYPSLSEEMIREALEYAAKLVRGKRGMSNLKFLLDENISN